MNERDQRLFEALSCILVKNCKKQDGTSPRYMDKYDIDKYDIKQEPSQPSHSLEPLVWSSSFSMGHPEIDDQHRQLMKIANQLITLSAHATPNKVRYAHLMEEIGEYLRLHLLYEEQLMSAVNYPWLKQHRDSHAQIMVKMAAFIGADKVSQLPQVIAFMREWLFEHIQVEDMRFKKYL